MASRTGGRFWSVDQELGNQGPFYRFGDFEGFVLRTDHGAEKQFRSREDRLAELARWAWQARIRTTVLAEEHEPHLAIRPDMHAR